MGKGGFEPPRPRAHDPKSCSSASSDTSPASEPTNYGSDVNQNVNQVLTNKIIVSFLASRSAGLSRHTITFYHRCLNKAVGIELTPTGITEFLHNLECGNAKHAYYRALRALCRWLDRQGELTENPITKVEIPKKSGKLLPAISEEQLELLLAQADNLRDRCIVSLMFDSGLRLSEICTIQTDDLDWSTNTLRVVVKGNKEAKAAFTSRTGQLLQAYIANNTDSSDTLFGMKPRGVQDMLSRMSNQLGFPCNAHSFRRGFACNLHRKGVSTLSIMHLGRWSSLDMVARYCSSINFDECLEHYKQANGS